MSDIRYLLDQHVDPRLLRGLRRQWPDMTVWRIGDAGAPSFGVKDPEILEWCTEHGFLLVTNNRSSMPVHLRERIEAGRQVSGIILLNPGLTLGETIDELATIWAATTIEDHTDLIRYLRTTT